MKIRIETREEVANIFTPYNPDFVRAVKKIGGAKWDELEKCWTVPTEAVGAAREIIERIYGYNDTKTSEMFSVRLKVVKEIEEEQAAITLMGKVLCRAFGRDSGGKIGDDVVYVKGMCDSGGPSKHWTSIVCADSIIVLNNVSKALYDAYSKNPTLAEYIEIISVTGNGIDKNALRREREQLENRIKEIDELLARENEA